jgi:hypothetical protein
MNQNYVHVTSAYGHLAGEMIRLLLESVDIPVLVVQESAGITYGMTVGSLGEVKVYVPADRAEEAVQVIQTIQQGDLGESISPSQLESYPEDEDNKLSPDEQIKE